MSARPTPGDFDGGKRAFGQAHSSSERSVGYFLLMPRSVQNHPNPLPYQTRSNPTVTLSVIGLCSVRWSTVRGPNIGHFGAFLGSLKGVSGLLDGSLGLSVTVGLIAGNESRSGFALNSCCQRREVAGSRPAQAPLIHNAQHHRACYPQEPCISWFSQISLCPSVMMR